MFDIPLFRNKLIRRLNGKTSPLIGIEDRAKYTWRFNMQDREPIYQSVVAYKRTCIKVTYKPVLFYIFISVFHLLLNFPFGIDSVKHIKRINYQFLFLTGRYRPAFAERKHPNCIQVIPPLSCVREQFPWRVAEQFFCLIERSPVHRRKISCV